MGRIRTSLPVLLLSFTLFAPSVAASFPDVPSAHSNSRAIDYLQSRGVIRGYADGSFRPYQQVTRAEFTALILRLRHADQQLGCNGYSKFPDVSMHAWYADAVCAAERGGMIDGNPDGTFRPEDSISFVEAAKIIVTTDTGRLTESGVWYKSYVQALEKRKAIPTTVTGFDAPLTRADIAEILWRTDARVSTQPSLTYANLASGSSSSSSYRPTLLASVTLTPFFYYDNRDIRDLEDLDVPNETVTAADLTEWDDIATTVVRNDNLPPAMAEKLYASLAVAQHDVLAIGQQVGGVSRDAIYLTSANVLCHFSVHSCDQYLRTTRDTDNRFERSISALVLRELTTVWNKDTQTALPMQGSWNAPVPVDSFAARWQWWVDGDNFDFPKDSPRIGSRDDADEMDQVRHDLRYTTPEQLSAVSKWLLREGPNNISTVWFRTAGDLLRKEDADASRAAEVRMVLAFAMADALRASYEVKYTFWTERPSMRDSSIMPLVRVPNSPSFVSEQAAISHAAAVVLGDFFPDEASRLSDDADAAGDSTVSAGIHFPIDVEAGKDIGQQIGKNTLDWYQDFKR